MFRKILVPVDFTGKNLRAVRAAARVAEMSGAQATLLHVIEPIDAERTGALEAFYRRLERSARERLKPFRAEFEKRKLAAGAEILYGKPVEEILRFAEREGVGLIVMSSHKLPLRRPAENWGTVSYKVGILARCPVLLVK